MHELGIVKHVIKTLTEVAEENRVTKICSVALRIGEVSGVVNEQLADCWDYFCDKQEMFKGSKLKIETIPAVTYCSGCGRTYETLVHGKICPFCGSEETWLSCGNEFEIKEIDAVTEDG